MTSSIYATPPVAARARAPQVAFLNWPEGRHSAFDVYRDRAEALFPAVANDGKCFYRANELLKSIDVPSSQKVVLNVMFDGLFTFDGKEGFDCQHVAGILKNGWTKASFPDGAIVPLDAVQAIVDPDCYGTDGLSLRAWQSQEYGNLPIRFLSSGPRTACTRAR